MLGAGADGGVHRPWHSLSRPCIPETDIPIQIVLSARDSNPDMLIQGQASLDFPLEQLQAERVMGQHDFHRLNLGRR